MTPWIHRRAINAFVDRHRDELVDLACELVAARTPNPPGDVRPAATVVADRLRALGINGLEVYAADAAHPNLIVRIPGRGNGPTLLLNGHLDTKDPGDRGAWGMDPWSPTIRDGMLIGLGSADMKGAVAAMVYAALAVAEIGSDGTLVLAFTADEESGGPYGPAWLAGEGLLEADACVIGEPCGIRSDWEAIRLVSRGGAVFRVRVHGTQMHSSLSDQFDSVNASVEMARLMVKMADAGNCFLNYEPHPLVELGPTVNVGLRASAGVGYGILAGQAEFISDVRAVPGMTAEEITADVQALIDQATYEWPTLQAELQLELWSPPSEISSNHPVVCSLQSAAKLVLGRPIPLGAFPGGTDAHHFASAGIPTVPACGPGLLAVAHTPNEAVSVESVVQAAKIYAHAALTFLNS